MEIKKFKRKKAQVTIFIIFALILVVIILLLFTLLKSRKIEHKELDKKNPQRYIQSCAKDSLNQAIKILLEQGGYIEPKNYKKFEDTKVGYLCYTNTPYSQCVNQEPLLIDHLEKEIRSYVAPKIKECFETLKSSMEKEGYEIKIDNIMKIKSELKTKEVTLRIKRKIEISKNQEKKKYEDFTIKVNHPIYDLAMISRDIVDFEIRFGNFPNQGHNIFYPEFQIEFKNLEDDAETETKDDSKIYIVKDKFSGERFVFSIRNYPPNHGI